MDETSIPQPPRLDDLFVCRATVHKKDQPLSEKSKGSSHNVTFCMKIIMTNQQFNNYFVCANYSHRSNCIWCVKVLKMNAKPHAAPSLLHLLHQDRETHTLLALINCVNHKNQTRFNVKKEKKEKRCFSGHVSMNASRCAADLTAFDVRVL